MVSLTVVEEAIKYREQTNSIYHLSGAKQIPIPILYQDTNYLAQMKTDTSFLCESELSKWFNFSKHSDPFLVTPSAPCIISKGASK